MSGDRGQPFVSVLADMNDEDYRKKMAQQQALENVYPEAVVAPLARSAFKAMDAIVIPQTTKINIPTIGSNLPTKNLDPWAHVAMPSKEEILKIAKDNYIRSGKRQLFSKIDDLMESSTKRLVGEAGAYVNEKVNKQKRN